MREECVLSAGCVLRWCVGVRVGARQRHHAHLRGACVGLTVLLFFLMVFLLFYAYSWQYTPRRTADACRPSPAL